uniref:Uncharacterized protein n=1 Tax=Romanomermis culicivorax TaxID=13658 RepID=A0A915J7X8_ROMCU
MHRKNQNLTSIITARVQETMKNYPVKAESMSLWDSLQRNFNCCGTLNYTDWSDSVAYYRINEKLPQGCCGYTVHSEEIVTSDFRETVCSADSADLYIGKPKPYDPGLGCLDKMLTWINKNSTIISSVGLVIASLQVFEILFSCCLARRVKRDDEYYYSYY